MFKARIHAWKLHKNITKAQRATLLRKARQLKGSEQLVLGRRPVLHRLERYCRENKVSLKDLETATPRQRRRPLLSPLNASEPTESAAVRMQSLFQPPTEPSQRVEIYGDMKTAEVIIWNAESYFNFYLTAGPGTHYYSAQLTCAAPNEFLGPSLVLVENEQAWDGVVDPVEFFVHAYDALSALKMGLTKSAFNAMGKAQSLLRILFQQQEPSLFPNLIDILMRLRQQNSQFTKAALQFIVDMASTMLSPVHPLSIIIKALCALPSIVDRMCVWRALTDVQSRFFASVEDRRLIEESRWDYFFGLEQMGHIKEAEDYLDQLFTTDERVKEEDPKYLYNKGLILEVQHKYIEAEFQFRKCLELTSQDEQRVLAGVTRSSLSDWLEAIEISLYGLAKVLEFTDRVEEAKAMWWRHLESVCARLGPDTVDTQCTGAHFDDFLLRHDYIEESAALRARFPLLLQRTILPRESL